MTEYEFDEYWPLLSTVFTKIGALFVQQNGEVEVQKYEYRRRKSKKEESHHLEEFKNAMAKLFACQASDVRIETTRTVSAPVTITIQRLDENEHRHNLE